MTNHRPTGLARFNFLSGPDGAVSNTKLVGWAVLGASFALGAQGRLTSTAWTTLAVALLAASFGAKVFLTFLNRNEWKNASTETVAVTGDLAKMAEVIRSRRDPATGIEATP